MECGHIYMYIYRCCSEIELYRCMSFFLSFSNQKADPEMLEFMQKLRKVVTVGIVGGSDLVKIQEQLGESCITDYDYLFAENGLVAHKGGDLLAIQSLKKHLGEDSLKVCCIIPGEEEIKSMSIFF